MNDEPHLLRIPEVFHSIEGVLETAKRLDLPNVLVLSEREDGSIVFLSSEMNAAELNWLIDRAKVLLVWPEQIMMPGAMA